MKLFAKSFARLVEAIYVTRSIFLSLVRSSISFISWIFHLHLCEKWLFRHICAWKTHFLSLILLFKQIKLYTSINIDLLQLISKVQNHRSVIFGIFCCFFAYFFFSSMYRCFVVYFILNKHIYMFIRCIFHSMQFFFYFAYFLCDFFHFFIS